MPSHREGHQLPLELFVSCFEKPEGGLFNVRWVGVHLLIVGLHGWTSRQRGTIADFLTCSTKMRSDFVIRRDSVFVFDRAVWSASES